MTQAQATQLDILLCRINNVIASLGQLPRPHISDDADGSKMVEWIFPKFRVGFNLEPDPEDSGYHLVSDNRTESGPLRLVDMDNVIVRIFAFIVENELR